MHVCVPIRIILWEVSSKVGLLLQMLDFQSFLLWEYARWMWWYAWNDARVKRHDYCMTMIYAKTRIFPNMPMQWILDGRFFCNKTSLTKGKRLFDGVITWFPDTYFELNSYWCIVGFFFEEIESLERTYPSVALLHQSVGYLKMFSS